MMKTYIKKKINEILRTRAIKAEWRKNIQKEMQIFFNQLLMKSLKKIQIR